ncbi:uncharacterized protein LOC129943993 [Eupeodes corollae]|uniref:uncharacterized protein LOC129943993 n=1 Tax=Eupeodes corollae TaxID=290404 RepID=UPI00249065A9|nr:uncharacterized protein LOC129943993 [Eupeodes corollae]
MKVLVCFFAVLAVASAGLISTGGLYSTGGIISSPAVTVVQSAPAVHQTVHQTVHVVKQPVVHTVSYSAPAQIYQPAHIIHSAPVVSTSVVSSPVVSTSYSHNYRYASSYGLGGVKVLNAGFLKHK